MSDTRILKCGCGRDLVLEPLKIWTDEDFVECGCGGVFHYDSHKGRFIYSGTRTPTPTKDVAQQEHYTQHAIQPITFITANNLNFCQGNIIKYIMRYKAKNGLEDLKKAQVYLGYLIQELENGEVKP